MYISLTYQLQPACSHSIFTLPFEIMLLTRLQTHRFVLKSKLCCHTGFIAVMTSMCKHRFLTSVPHVGFFLPCSCCRCLTTPPNPDRRRLTVTPQMASLYSSSRMPALSPSRWYPAWGKKWSVTVTRWVISWLQAKSGTRRAVCQCDRYRKDTCTIHVVIITILALPCPKYGWSDLKMHHLKLIFILLVSMQI